MNETVEDSQHDHSLTSESLTINSDPPISNLNLEDITTAAIQFFSTASPEAVIGVAVAFATFLYFVLGRIGLLIIGAVGGIILHSTWEHQNTPNYTSARQEKSLDIIKKILDLSNSSIKNGTGHDENETIYESFENFQPETAAALKELVNAVIRDYVKSWYQPIIPRDTSFPTTCQQSLTRFIISISNHLSKKRPEDIFLNFLTNSSSIVIVFLSELSNALTLSPGTTVDAVYSYLFNNPNSSLANSLDEQNQTKQLRITTADLLQNYLDKSVYQCSPARVFLNEVLSRLALESTIKSCSKSEWINGWIVLLLEKGESDLSQAIDAGMDDGRHNRNSDDHTENLGNNGPARGSSLISQRDQYTTPKNKRLIKSVKAIDEDTNEATLEAIRLSNLIAEEESKKNKLGTSQNPKAKSSTALAGKDDKLPYTRSKKNMTEKPSTEKKPIKTLVSEKLNLKESQNTDQSDLNNSKLYPESQQPTVPITTQSSYPSIADSDQIILDPTSDSKDGSMPISKRTCLLTLHNANITIYDDSASSERGKLRSKPSMDYLIQIEPASSNHPGWMIVRRYSDFESLHEILRRIAQVSGVTTFTEQHQNFPSWKESTKASLRGDLQQYLRDACWYQPLAESEGMKRFFKKDQEQHNTSSSSKNGFPTIGWSTPSAMGKGMLEVLSSAPKGVSDSGKAITGVFNNIGNLGPKKYAGGQTEKISRLESTGSAAPFQASPTIEDNHNSFKLMHSNKTQQLEQRLGYDFIAADEDQYKAKSSSSSVRSSLSDHQSSDLNHDSTEPSSQRDTPDSSPVQFTVDSLILPPPPTEMPDDYSTSSVNGSILGHGIPGNNCNSNRTNINSLNHPREMQNIPAIQTNKNLTPGPASTQKPQRASKPLVEAETRVAVELIFAVVNEMYTISSAWNIRRTLLSAAKTYFLRPGNPSLLKIQSLIQESVINANTSDIGIAAHLRKLRENCMPNKDELKAWPSEMTSEDKERLRIKARELLIKRGVPTALTGVMGQAATSEAMGRIFDCLQIEEVARGLIFGVLLQGIRAVFY